jgi:hypothetical protein
MPPIEDIDRAIRFGNMTAILLAIVGAALVFFAWRWLDRRSPFHLLVGFAATLALGIVYFAASTQIISGAYPIRQPAGEQDFVLSAYVHPGPLIRLAPGIAITVTWATLLMFSRKLAGRDNRSPTPRSS